MAADDRQGAYIQRMYANEQTEFASARKRFECFSQIQDIRGNNEKSFRSRLTDADRGMLAFRGKRMADGKRIFGEYPRTSKRSLRVPGNESKDFRRKNTRVLIVGVLNKSLENRNRKTYVTLYIRMGQGGRKRKPSFTKGQANKSAGWMPWH